MAEGPSKAQGRQARPRAKESVPVPMPWRGGESFADPELWMLQRLTLHCQVFSDLLTVLEEARDYLQMMRFKCTHETLPISQAYAQSSHVLGNRNLHHKLYANFLKPLWHTVKNKIMPNQ